MVVGPVMEVKENCQGKISHRRHSKAANPALSPFRDFINRVKIRVWLYQGLLDILTDETFRERFSWSSGIDSHKLCGMKTEGSKKPI